VSLFDVLEHLHDPRRTLASCVAAAAAGRHRVPLRAELRLGLAAADGGRRALHLADPSPELLHAGDDAGLSARAGLETVYVATEGLDIVDYLWYRREVHGPAMTASKPSPIAAVLHQRGRLRQEPARDRPRAPMSRETSRTCLVVMYHYVRGQCGHRVSQHPGD
jgi:hypothetical protein